ncbi:hypothetical protein PS1_026662 [Malus domestica]
MYKKWNLSCQAVLPHQNSSSFPRILPHRHSPTAVFPAKFLVELCLRPPTPPFPPSHQSPYPTPSSKTKTCQ